MISNKSENIIIFPFEVHGDGNTFAGRVVSDSLILQLRKIWEIHQSEYAGICLSEQLEYGYAEIEPEKLPLYDISPEKENFETKVSSLGDLKFEGMNIPVGNFFTIIREIWPWGVPPTKITGRLQDSDSEIYLVVLMEGLNKGGWKCKCDI
ncbi:MAG: hypothetical protein AB3K77_03215 [Methanosarcinaceae archaeon]